MERGGDKIIVKLNVGDGHFVYFTVHDEDDSGSIIDLAIATGGGMFRKPGGKLKWRPALLQLERPVDADRTRR